MVPAVILFSLVVPKTKPHITLIKGTSNTGETILKQLDSSTVRFQGTDSLPLPHLPHGKRADGAEETQA